MPGKDAAKQVSTKDSTMHDLTHKRAGTAGNKSYLPHRQDVGIIGYTGYNPSWGAVPVPTKSIAPRTGRPLPQELIDEALLAPRNMHRATETRKCYTADPTSYNPVREETLLRKQSRAPCAAAPFIGSTTKVEEIDNGGSTAEQQLSRTAGIKATTVMHGEAGQQHRFTGPPAPRSMPAIKATPEALAVELTQQPLTQGGTIKLQTGYLAGYYTTYDRFNTFQALQDERPPPATAPPLRKEDLPFQVAYVPLDGTSTYMQAHGREFSDPNARPIEGLAPHQLKLAAGLRPLAEGTPGDSHHMSSYMGFIPASKVNPTAVAQADGIAPRPDDKVGMLQFKLDQWQRTRLAGTGTFKPQALSNIAVEMPAQGPNQRSNYGASNAEGLQFPLTQKDRTKFINSNLGIMKFFTRPPIMDSALGIQQTQQYYYQVRPLEGSIVRTVPAERSPYGNYWANADVSTKPCNLGSQTERTKQRF